MQIFLDSAKINEIEEVNTLGIIDGVTTNPSLVSQISGAFELNIQKICSIIKGDVSVEVTANNFDLMIEQGKRLLNIASNVVIKLPITYDGLRACQYLVNAGAKVNMTLCFSVNQALFAAKSGASYVSPFVGRLDDIGYDGINLLQDIKNVYMNYPHLRTKILAASIRSPNHLYKAALIGVDVATIPFGLIKQLIQHPLTIQGIEKFNNDWSKSGFSI